MTSWFDYFSQHQDYFFFAIGAVCVLVELGLLKFSGPFIFLAIGSLLTGVFISFGLITQFTIALVICAGFTGASAGLLWAPLKAVHNDSFSMDEDDALETAVGNIVLASAPITTTEGRVFYAESEWPARLDAGGNSVPAGSQVLVTEVDGVVLVVREFE